MLDDRDAPPSAPPLYDALPDLPTPNLAGVSCSAGNLLLKSNYIPTLYNFPRTTNTVVSFIIIAQCVCVCACVISEQLNQENGKSYGTGFFGKVKR